jgi:hypothetical protein
LGCEKVLVAGHEDLSQSMDRLREDGEIVTVANAQFECRRRTDDHRLRAEERHGFVG